MNGGRGFRKRNYVTIVLVPFIQYVNAKVVVVVVQNVTRRTGHLIMELILFIIRNTMDLNHSDNFGYLKYIT